MQEDPDWRWCQTTNMKQRVDYYNSFASQARTFRASIAASKVVTVNFVDQLPEKRSNLAVCVIPANEDAQQFLDITRDSIKRYAEKCGADYIELQDDQHPNWPMANKYRVYSVSSVYDKTLYLDCDISIRDTAPDLFKITPDNKFSVYEEISDWENRNWTTWIETEQSLIKRKFLTSEQIDNAPKALRMYNGGVMMIPKSLAHYYKQPDKTYPKMWCFDQHYLTLTLPEEYHHQLDQKFNFCWQVFDFTNTNAHCDFLTQANEAYFLHVNGERNIQLRKKILSWDFSDPIKCGLITHEDVSCATKFNECSDSLEKQEELNKDIYKYAKNQKKTNSFTIDDVCILCLGHSDKQFKTIEPRSYLKFVNFNDYTAGKYRGNEWAEARAYHIHESIFEDAEFYGFVTASWNTKYTTTRIDNFHKLFTTNLLIDSDPEDKIFLCADMFCSCIWLKNKNHKHGIIADCIGGTKDVWINLELRKLLKDLDLKSDIHKPVPFSSQGIFHKTIYHEWKKFLNDKNVYDKVNSVVENLGIDINYWNKHQPQHSSFRVHAYFMEAIHCFWCANQDYKFIATTNRIVNWYHHDSRKLRGW